VEAAEGPELAQLDTDVALAEMRAILEGAGGGKGGLTLVGHNLKFVANVLKRHNIDLLPSATVGSDGRTLIGRWDAALASYVLNPTRPAVDLASLAQGHLARQLAAPSDLQGKCNTRYRIL
jgi:DNA polymerase I-like protein with 3'-5' exonuclease and polymerase domains